MTEEPGLTPRAGPPEAGAGQESLRAMSFQTQTIPSDPMERDLGQLRLLAIFHYVVAAIGAVFACFPLIHVFIGIMMMVRPEMMPEGSSAAQPAWLGFFFAAFGGMFVLAGWAAAVCTFISGRFLARRRRRMFSFVLGAILCAFMPFGTILGIFTIIVLSRESVQRLYATAEPTGATPPTVPNPAEPPPL